MANKLTLGLELEIACLSPQAEEIIAKRGFHKQHDGSIRRPDDMPSAECGEIATGVLDVTVSMNRGIPTIDYGKTMEVIDDLCRCAKLVNNSCGVHIHIGRPRSETDLKSKWSVDQLKTFIVIGKMMENTLYDLCPDSRKNDREVHSFCQNIHEIFNNSDLLNENLIAGAIHDNKYSNRQRRCWLNITEVFRDGQGSTIGSAASPKTVEIRMLGNTKRSAYIQAWTKLWLKIGAYVAYAPATTAILHCTDLGYGIRDEVEEVKSIKLARMTKTEAKPKRESSRTSSRAAREDTEDSE